MTGYMTIAPDLFMVGLTFRMSGELNISKLGRNNLIYYIKTGSNIEVYCKNPMYASGTLHIIHNYNFEIIMEKVNSVPSNIVLL